MGADYVNLRKKSKRQQRKVARKDQGSSSNRPELRDNPHALFVGEVHGAGYPAFPHKLRTGP